MKKIAVIGAGIAGLACARVLNDHGHHVQLFDKGRGPGGRMSTRRVATSLGEVGFDHGAQYFTARDAAFVAEVERLSKIGAVAPWLGDLVRVHRDGKNSPLAQGSLFVGTPTMNSVVKVQSEGLSIAWSTRVETISSEGDLWRLRSDRGEDLGVYDCIVCAVPAEQVAPLMDAIAPHFGGMAKAISSLPCWAGLFAFERALCIPFDAMRLDSHTSIDFIAMNHSKPARADIASYVVHGRPDWSANHLEDAPEAVAEQLLADLLVLSDDRPNLVHSSAHRWRYARVEVGQGLGHVFDATQNIGMCGDWLSGPRVESAWLSGHQLGLEITGQDIAPKIHKSKAGE
jgi:renalase